MVWNVSQSSGPYDVTATFFLNGVSYTPSSVTLTIVYPTLANPLITASCAIGMTLSANTANWLATWSSSVAGLGAGTLTAVPSVGATLTDKIRVTQ